MRCDVSLFSNTVTLLVELPACCSMISVVVLLFTVLLPPHGWLPTPSVTWSSVQQVLSYHQSYSLTHRSLSHWRSVWVCVLGAAARGQNGSSEQHCAEHDFLKDRESKCERKTLLISPSPSGRNGRRCPLRIAAPGLLSLAETALHPTLCFRWKSPLTFLSLSLPPSGLFFPCLRALSPFHHPRRASTGLTHARVPATSDGSDCRHCHSIQVRFVLALSATQSAQPSNETVVRSISLTHFVHSISAIASSWVSFAASVFRCWFWQFCFCLTLVSLPYRCDNYAMCNFLSLCIHPPITDLLISLPIGNKRINWISHAFP